MLPVFSEALKPWFAIFVMGVACGVPIATGLAVAVDPLNQRQAPEWVAVTTLESLPADGVPRRFPVVLPHSDAWTTLPSEPVGFVFFKRLPDSAKVTGLRTMYGRVSCSVEIDTATGTFTVPCLKDVRFDFDGRALSPNSEAEDLATVRIDVRSGKIYVNLSNVSAR